MGDAVPHIHRMVKADAYCLSVAAASILAKVTRDRVMRGVADSYPHWSFDTNKGYPCPIHKAALQGYGPSAIHRRTWVFMDHYVPWPGMRVYRPGQPTLFDACAQLSAVEGLLEVGDEVGAPTRARPTGARAPPAPRAASRPPTRASCARGARSATRPRRATRPA